MYAAKSTSGVPSLFATGDKVRFEPVAESEYERIKAAVARGDYRPVSETVGP